jgi:tRNA(fMet)-specific endonuclease VapC
MAESSGGTLLRPVYLLDANACIRYLNGRSPLLRERLRSHVPQHIAVSSVVKAEMFAGARRSSNPDRSLASQRQFFSPFASLQFDDAAADVYGTIRADLEVAGNLIGPYDLQIAAIAIANGLVLVTHNTREFGRVAELMLEDLEAE